MTNTEEIVTSRLTNAVARALGIDADRVTADLLKRSMADRDIVVGTAADGTSTVQIMKTPLRLRKAVDADAAIETFERNQKIALQAASEMFSDQLIEKFKDQALALTTDGRMVWAGVPLT